MPTPITPLFRALGFGFDHDGLQLPSLPPLRGAFVVPTAREDSLPTGCVETIHHEQPLLGPCAKVMIRARGLPNGRLGDIVKNAHVDRADDWAIVVTVVSRIAITS